MLVEEEEPVSNATKRVTWPESALELRNKKSHKGLEVKVVQDLLQEEIVLGLLRPKVQSNLPEEDVQLHQTVQLEEEAIWKLKNLNMSLVNSQNCLSLLFLTM